MSVACYANLQLDAQWTSQGDSPGEHGKGTIVPGTTTKPMQVMFAPAKRPPGAPWDNLFCLHRNLGSDCCRWVYSVTASFPTQQDITNCHAFEMDFQQNQGFLICNCGWQLLPGTGLRVWDRSQHKWSDAGLPLAVAVFQPGVPKRITVLLHHDATQVHYDGIAIDGAWWPLDLSAPVVPGVQHPYANTGIQVDSNGQGGPINFAVWDCSLVGM